MLFCSHIQHNMDIDLNKIIYWISTIVMCGVFAFSASMYFTKTEMVRGFFDSLGYPSYIVIPLAIAKVLGIIAILTKQSKMLMEWAYAGFLIDAVLAFVAHQVADDGGSMFSIVAIVSLVFSRIFYSRVYR